MKQYSSHNLVVLALAPSSRGVGFAVMEGNGALVGWGVKVVKGEKNSQSVAAVANLVALHEPTIIVLEDAEIPGTRRHVRIQALNRELITLSKSKRIKIRQVSRKQVRKCFFSDGIGTKHALAEMLGARFPEELGHRVPRKRRPWTSEDSRMDIFDAVALAVHVQRNESLKQDRNASPA